MKKLVTKVKRWFKDRNDRKNREFLERTRIEMEKYDDGSATKLPKDDKAKERVQ